jgi:hypothetical protein
MPVSETVNPTEWGNTAKVFEVFGLKKGVLYKLADTGQIKWTLVKTEKTNKKGTRLFDLNSIRELLAANVSWSFAPDSWRDFGQKRFSVALRRMALLGPNIFHYQPGDVLRTVHPLGSRGLVHRFLEFQRAGERQADVRSHAIGRVFWFTRHKLR